MEGVKDEFIEESNNPAENNALQPCINLRKLDNVEILYHTGDRRLKKGNGNPSRSKMKF